MTEGKRLDRYTLIVEEAVGIVRNFGRADWSHRGHGIVATCTPRIAATVVQLLR